MTRALSALAAPLCVTLCLTSVGCSATTAGTATPAAPGPQVGPGALPGLLLSAADVQTVLASPQLVVTGEVSAPWHELGQLGDPDCLAIAGAAQREVYAGSGWTALRGQVLREPPAATSWSHYAVQAVVLFPAATAAADFFTASQSGWARCADRELTYAQQPAPDQVWSVGPITVDRDVLAVSRVQRSPQRWACQRALTVHGNAAIDVEACSLDGNTPAATAIARSISDRLPSA